MLCQLLVEELLNHILLFQLLCNKPLKLTRLAIRNPRGVTDATLPATNCCKSCRLLVVALKHILLFQFFCNNQ